MGTERGRQKRPLVIAPTSHPQSTEQGKPSTERHSFTTNTNSPSLSPRKRALSAG
jgi:hypothetical protein